MANEFKRKPIDGGDDGAWAPFNDAQNKNTYGINTSQLFDDSGDIKVTVGRIGTQDGTNEGTSDIDTETTIKTAAQIVADLTASRWAQVEMAVSGSSVTFSITSIAAGTDPAILPTEFTTSYNPTKGGFFISATKRTIGLIWVDASGVLEGVVNARSFEESYIGYSQSDDADDIKYSFNKKPIDEDKTVGFKRAEYVDDVGAKSIIKTYKKKLDIGDWNMDTLGALSFAHGLDRSKILSMLVYIRNDADSQTWPLDFPSAAGSNEGQFSFNNSTVSLARFAGGFFDSTTFDSTSYNRGHVILEYEG